MKSRFCVSIISAFLLLCSLPCFALAANSDHIRVSKTSSGAQVSLDTAIEHFVSVDGKIHVDLISAVHIAEHLYYEELNRRFKAYDAVLYELIAPYQHDFSRRPKEPQSIISKLQAGMKDMLGLEFQLEGINYTAPNLVHADFSPEDMFADMKKRGETPEVLIARFIAAAMVSAERKSKQKVSTDKSWALIGMLLGNNKSTRGRYLRKVFAEELENSDVLANILNNGKGSGLLAGRNDRALSVLVAQIKKGKRHMAIFYGGAHMDDMGRKLAAGIGKDLKFRKVSTDWLKAWDLR